MEQFYIDRAFGVAIWVYVEKGIVVECKNESEQYINRMHELYKGKTISFLNKDFVTRMKPAFHCVHNSDVVTAKISIHRIQTQIHQHYNTISSFNTPDETKEILREAIKELDIKLGEARGNLHDVKERVFKEHNFLN